MGNLNYRVDSDGGLSPEHTAEEAPDASSANAPAAAESTEPQASPLTRELDAAKAERLMEEIEAASAPGSVKSILTTGAAAARDPGCMLPDAEGGHGADLRASGSVDSQDEGRQWILPSLLAVLAISLGIFFLVTFTDAQDPQLGGGDADGPAAVSRGQSALYSSTRSKLAELSRQVGVWMSQYGDSSYPREVTLKRVREDLALSSDQMLDSWGKPIKYEAGDTGYTLRSSGTDKEFNTQDDLVERQTWIPSHP